MRYPGELSRLIDRARSRALLNLVSEQAAVGAIAFLGGAIVMLLVGTQILDWYWPAVLFGLGMGLSAWRTIRRVPSHYSVAQQVDGRLGLHDTLSTAFHFQRPGAAGRFDPELVAAHQEIARQTAARIAADAAMPWRLPRQLYTATVLAAAALALFGVRYGVRGRLDLKAPLVEAVTDFFRPGKEVIARAKQQPRLPGEEPLGIALDQSDDRRPDLEGTPDSLLAEVDIPDVNAAVETWDTEKAVKGQVKAQGDEMAEGDEEGEQTGGEAGREFADAAGKAGGNEAAKQGAQQQKQKGSGSEQSSLMDKMRDAMANLLSKLKIPPQAGQSAETSSKGSQSGQRDMASAQKGTKGEGQPQGQGAPGDDAEAGDQEGEQQAQAGQGKSSDKGSEQSVSNEAKSGMGKQDGSKELRDAEQLAAMGKLSEIFGKRAANVTGEVMVEVNSSKQQQLRTAYTQRGATHREAGGEIHRDEIPLEFQHYVQQYFEQVRKAETAEPKQP